MSWTDAIIGCWSPSVRASGYLLQDCSNYRNHGTLVGFNAGVAWTANRSGIMIEKTNTTDLITTTSSLPMIQVGNEVTLIMWGQRLASNSLLFFGRNALGSIYLSAFSDGNIYSVNGGVTLSASDSNTTINCYAMTQGSGTQRLYRNGVQIAGNTATSMNTSAANFSIGGITGFSGSGRMGECVAFAAELKPADIRRVYCMGNGAIGRMLTGQNRRPVYGIGARFQSAWARGSNVLLGFNQP